SLTVKVLAGSASLSLSWNCTFQPVRSLPLKSGVKPSSAARRAGVANAMANSVERQIFMDVALVGSCRVGGGFAQPTMADRWVPQSLHPPYKTASPLSKQILERRPRAQRLGEPVLGDLRFVWHAQRMVNRRAEVLR